MSRHPKLRSAGIAAFVAVALLLSLPPVAASAGRLAVPAAPRSSRMEVGGDAWKLFQATNASRGRFNLPALRLDRDLSVVARRHSTAMARSGALFHTADVDVYLHGMTWHSWGENVGYTPEDVASLQQAFMNSPPHRANILNRSFHEVAIGAVRVDGTLWVTVFFYG